MVIFGRCTIIPDLFYIAVLASVLKISSSSYCLEGKQYYDSERKQCLPCRTCNSPRVVIATCHIYSDTKCGLPTITGGSVLEVFQETSEDAKSIQTESENRNAYVATDVPQPKHDDPPFTLFDEENCTEQQNSTHKLVKKLCKSANKESSIGKSLEVNLSSEESTNISIFPSFGETANDSASKDLNPFSKPELNTNPDVKLKINSSEPILDDTSLRNFLFSYLGKIIVSAIVVLINLLLIIILIVKIIKHSYKRKSKDKSCSYFYNQKLPHPSQKPIKCRFTAVLPTKSPSEYANVDSYLNSLISPTFSSNSNSTNWNNSCVSSTMPAYTPQETSNTSRSLGSNPINSERDPVERDPLVLNSEVVENANMIQLYSRIPSPNPFTMDRLLEHRRAIGCTSVENNLYVETWCSSTSPMLSRSQESSVAPSPALSSIRKPLSSSNSSSPLTTRTFRATPIFSSFHPNRS